MNTNSKKYPVAETFLSVQGEGMHSGKRAFFIRLYGCNVRCPWCDSKYAWDAQQDKPPQMISAEDLAFAAQSSGAEIVVITGGEPAMHDLYSLLDALKRKGLALHIETSGTLEISKESLELIDWIALSPKLFFHPLDKMLSRADELKLIISSTDEIEKYLEIIKGKAERVQSIYLHPEASKMADKELLKGLSDFVVARGGLYRLGLQLHKLYSIL